MVTEQYIWQYKNWTNWAYDLAQLLPKLNQAHYQQGLLLGRLLDIGFDELAQINLQSLTHSIVKSSEIEGELLNPHSVRSSLARRLGVEIGGLLPVDRAVEGVVEMTLDATTHFEKPLTLERLFVWHAALFPTGYSGMSKINVAALRDDKEGAMQVISGGMGRQKIHFEAPPAAILPSEMTLFLDWVNGKDTLDPFIKAALAHLWFLTLHPFEDGNGRIARAIADFLLAKSENNALRFYSLSAQIQKVRSDYYDILENTQKGVNSITNWIAWFIENIIQAMQTAQKMLNQVLVKNRYWTKWNELDLNERQRKVLNLLLGDFEGNLTNKKYTALTKVSRDTALRDLTDLVKKNILRIQGGGRSVNYMIV